MDIKIKKGHTLDLAGAIADASAPAVEVVAASLAIVPDDFTGLVPKLEVKEGDHVKCGQPLFRDKNYENVKVVSPASAVVEAVVRGERRKILRVVLRPEAAEPQAYAVDKIATRDQAVELLCASGMLARMRQRPYDIVPRPDVAPRDIFVTAIDSAPLSAGYSRIVAGKAAALAQAVALLRLVTDGKVYLSVDDHWTLGDIPGAEMVKFTGKHPVGNVGVQIANIKPVNKGETVWGMGVDTLCKIGSLLASGHVDGSALVAITGSEVEQPALVTTTEGCDMPSLLAGRLAASDHHVRVISGNVLTGVAVSPDGYLRFPYRQVTVIPEGDDVAEFMGWASLSPKKLSVSNSFPGKFVHKLFKPDARLLGGRRAMIMSGEYDKMIPMDILPEYLIKAILSKNIEQMERLGIYEVAPEDFALAEYADTSKLPLQQIVRDGLDYLRKELE